MPDDERTADELAKQEAEPMHPAEWWLVGGSIGVGLLLLAVLLRATGAG